jgi:hypothetical protein
MSAKDQVTAAIICSGRDYTQDRLGLTLQSIEDAVGRAVVVYSGRDKERPDWMQSFAFIYPRPWDDHFSRARNTALAQCRTEWVLTIDAGEVLAQGHACRIENTVMKAREHQGVPGFLFDVLVPTGEDSETASLSKAIRLFRRRKAHKYICRAHNQLTVDRNEAIEVPITIVHRILPGDHEQRQRRNRKMLHLLRQDLKTEKDEAILLYTRRAIDKIKTYMEGV